MVMEKKLWALPSPFRRPGNQDPPKAKIGRSGSRVSSVYLSDDSSASGFVIVPEFDDPVRITQTMPEDSNSDSQHASKCSMATSSSFHKDSDLPDLNLVASKIGPYFHDHDASAGSVDDLEQRLGSAYEHVSAMHSPVSPAVVLSSDPQMLRKQLGVPQHSVLNYPIGSSLDLPNPYGGSPLPSPKPAASSPRRKPALRIKTNINSLTSHRSAPVQGASTSPITGEITTETFPFHPDASSDIATSPTDHQPPPVRLAKLARRRGESHPPASSLPSSAWQPLNTLKKATANSGPPTNEHKRQISLPQIRFPSPFTVDIPLHHSWHERRTKFGFSSDVASLKPKKRRTSESTEALASLAWIGTSPATSGNIAPPVAIAVDDENISDDVLVDRLERIRRIDSQCDEREDLLSSEPSFDLHSPSIGPASIPIGGPPPPQQLHHTEIGDTPPLRLKVATPDSEDSVVWLSARKALLCIREIVRTEKKYQEALRKLLNAQTATPPPPSMSPYVLALVRTSEMLLKGFLEDPSAWGVSTAFVTCEDELETTMVSWCSVAGTFFTDCNDTQPGRFTSRWRFRKAAVPSGGNGVTPTPSASPTAIRPSSPLLTQQLPPILPLINTASAKFGERSKAEQYPAPNSQTDPDPDVQAAAAVVLSSQFTESQAATDQRPNRMLGVRDLAIQPIQRIMRYVLLYRDLLHCTPSNCPSHLLVERALEVAMRIANRCDRAQSNPAFCLAS